MNLKIKLWWEQHKDKIFKIYAITLTLVVVILGVMYFTYSKFSSKNEMVIYETTVEPFIKNDYFIASYIDGEWSDSIPGKDAGYEVDKIVCDNGATGTWDNDKWALTIENATKKIKCSVFFKEKIQFNFDYTGTEQVFTVPKSGTYKLETWGAQGGFSSNYGISNYGGYSTGYIYLNNHEIIYINIGGRGSYEYKGQGGYNGGAYGAYGTKYKSSGGGGATHIAAKSGILSLLENDKSEILIVSGGGGGAYDLSSGGGGGGYIGNSGLYSSEFNKNICGKGADQNNGGSKTQSSYGSSNSGIFGAGGDGGKTDADGGGGGGGLYGGGGCPDNGTGGGGSGYIGNSLLTNKAMYCYNCEESSEESTKTISTTCAEETPTANCAKKGNGYARITFIE